jgi:uncharacterized protein (DUF433 family)
VSAPGTKPKWWLSVRNVAETLEAGDIAEMILEDYPYLTREDFEFARLYHRINPAA